MYYIKQYILKTEFINKWKSQVKKGTLSFIVLNAINKKELYGYELIEIIKETTAIEIAEGTLYPLMNRLKKEGLATSKWVEQESGIPRKYYMLTKDGNLTLTQMHKYWNELERSIKNITNHGI
jgi:PadR family transcriptional regulator PadR